MDETKSEHRSSKGRDGVSRRRFFERLGWLGMVLVGLASIPATIRFLKPGRLASGRRAFDAGSLQDFSGITVSTRWLKRHRLWVVKNQGALFALQARCPHLGCTPRWEPHTQMFRCPCHGSQFSLEGIALNGPAKDPLKRAAVWVDGSRVMIDPGRLVSLEEAEGSEGYSIAL
jgi:cytochrome b6-f complex iron-sulfur subunit